MSRSVQLENINNEKNEEQLSCMGLYNAVLNALG